VSEIADEKEGSSQKGCAESRAKKEKVTVPVGGFRAPYFFGFRLSSGWMGRPHPAAIRFDIPA